MTKFQLRVTHEELRIWREAAESRGLSLSDWVRRTVTDASLEAGAPVQVQAALVTVVDEETPPERIQEVRATAAAVGQPKPRRPRTKPCAHRLPPEAWCKVCDA